MSDSDIAAPSNALGLVTTVQARGRGIIILSGPSSCGKGAIAAAIREMLHLPVENHVSMGDALRRIVVRADEDEAFRNGMDERFGISATRCIFDYDNSNVIAKARSYADLIDRYGERPSEVQWLQFCVTRGLLAPDSWSRRVIEETLKDLADKPEAVVVLDGYPRTEVAAESVLGLSKKLGLPIIKVIHLSVSKRQMIERALVRKRLDDTPEMLERRYAFYVEHVQCSVELLKARLGPDKVALIDAHLPVYDDAGKLDLPVSIRNVSDRVMMALGVPRIILDSIHR